MKKIMPWFRSKSKLLCLLFLSGIFLLVLDTHTDCGEMSPAPMAAHHCCVQCCPSHTLGPASQFSIKFSSLNHLLIRFYSDKAFCYQNPFLASPYRPPIA